MSRRYVYMALIPVVAYFSYPSDGGCTSGESLALDERDGIRVFQETNRGVVHVNGLGHDANGSPDATRCDTRGGSGVVLDTQGRILTNYHLVEGAEQIEVTGVGSRVFVAQLIGGDSRNDLAVIQIRSASEMLHPVRWGDSSDLRIGQRIYALGNSDGNERTLATGIVGGLNSAMRGANGRLIMGGIRPDVAIRIEDSGGPLINRKCELVGISIMMKWMEPTSRLSIAIPSNTARRVAEDLIRHGRVIWADCGILAVERHDRGLLLQCLSHGGAAQRAGLRGQEARVFQCNFFSPSFCHGDEADLLVAVDGLPVKSYTELLARVATRRPGDKMTFSIERDGKMTDVCVELQQEK